MEHMLKLSYLSVRLANISIGEMKKTQNVLAICDFDRRFIFVAAGIPGSAHDWTVLQEAIHKYGTNFPYPSAGKLFASKHCCMLQ